MLLPRIIPCLLVHNKGLVKTVQFGNHKYVGDPINAVRIFNEKEVDELMVLDIDATVLNHEPDYRMIENLASECRMPFCYGGGIKTVDQALKIFTLGVEKIAISSVALSDISIITKIAEIVGNQSVVVVLDIKRQNKNGRYEIYTHNGSRNTKIDPVAFVTELEKAGAGEIVLNSIDEDGRMQGFDYPIIHMIHEKIKVPLTIIGGAGSWDDLGKLISQNGIIGAAAGSLFVFKGKYKAVLINYPNREEKIKIIQNYYKPNEANYSRS